MLWLGWRGGKEMTVGGEQGRGSEREGDRVQGGGVCVCGCGGGKGKSC